MMVIGPRITLHLIMALRCSFLLSIHHKRENCTDAEHKMKTHVFFPLPSSGSFSHEIIKSLSASSHRALKDLGYTDPFHSQTGKGVRVASTHNSHHWQLQNGTVKRELTKHALWKTYVHITTYETSQKKHSAAFSYFFIVLFLIFNIKTKKSLRPWYLVVFHVWFT